MRKTLTTMIMLTFLGVLLLSDANSEGEYPNQELRSVLLQMMEVDQEARRRGDPQATLKIDRQHAAFLSSLLEAGNWPKLSEVGPDGAQAAWILAQHADHDLEFQKSVLTILEEYAEKGEANPPDVALLHDRVAVAEGRPQRYGTQGRCVNDEGWVPREIESTTTVRELREEMGLPSFDAYVERMQRFCQ